MQDSLSIFKSWTTRWNDSLHLRHLYLVSINTKSVFCLLSSLLHQQSCLLCGKLDRIFDCEYRLLIERFILLNIAEVRFINILKSMSKIFFWLRVVLLLGCYDELVVYSHWFFSHIYRTCNTLLTRYRFLPVSC